MKKLLVLLIGIALFFVVHNSLVAMNGDKLASIGKQLDMIQEMRKTLGEMKGESPNLNTWIQTTSATLTAHEKELLAQERAELDIAEKIIAETAGIENLSLRQKIANCIRREADKRKMQENKERFEEIISSW